jgi:hypothetical protein
MATYGHAPRLPCARALKRRAMRASTPIPAMLKNARPLKVPASIARRGPSSARARAIAAALGTPRGGEAVSRSRGHQP